MGRGTQRTETEPRSRRYSPLYGQHPHRTGPERPFYRRPVMLARMFSVPARDIRAGDWLVDSGGTGGLLVLENTHLPEQNVNHLRYRGKEGPSVYRSDIVLWVDSQRPASGPNRVWLTGGPADGLSFKTDRTPMTISVFEQPDGAVMIREDLTTVPGPVSSEAQWVGSYRLESADDQLARYTLSASRSES